VAFFRRQGDAIQDYSNENQKDEKDEALLDSMKQKLDFEVLNVKQIERIECLGYQGADANGELRRSTHAYQIRVNQDPEASWQKK
jgi:hypothetical protein